MAQIYQSLVSPPASTLAQQQLKCDLFPLTPDHWCTVPKLCHLGTVDRRERSIPLEERDVEVIVYVRSMSTAQCCWWMTASQLTRLILADQTVLARRRMELLQYDMYNHLLLIKRSASHSFTSWPTWWILWLKLCPPFNVQIIWVCDDDWRPNFRTCSSSEPSSLRPERRPSRDPIIYPALWFSPLFLLYGICLFCMTVCPYWLLLI